MKTLTSTCTASLLFFIVPSLTAQETCQPCAGGEEPDLDRQVCVELDSKSTGLDPTSEECKEIQLTNYQYGCCTSAPRDICTMCADGSSFQTSRRVPNFTPGKDDLTCIDLNSDPSYLDFMNDPGTCEDTLLRRSASWCGCPGAQRECFLCPDRSPPPKRSLVDNVYYDWSCRTFDYVSSYFNAEECVGLADTILDFDAAAFCGCEGTTPPGVCSLCPDGTKVVDPDIPIEDNSFTCQDLALSTNFIPTIASCVKVLGTYRAAGIQDICCVSISSDAPAPVLPSLAVVAVLIGLTSLGLVMQM